ncbi:hypothetical protein RB653_009212 [Dictyostelium firmibasis]|uniref:Uncharacterized protein n=1 Tax=Dictyostelium firmibasis TaxID=79012 RepID=A0AAN7UDW6_9MYCE
MQQLFGLEGSICAGFNNAQFTPITPETTLSASVLNPIYSFVPTQSSSIWCKINPLQIYIEASSGTSIINTSTNATNYIINLIIQTNNKYLYSLSSQYSQSIGIAVQNITFTTNDTNTHTYQFVSTCNDFKIDNLN